jgi:hypothetical protein
VKKKGGPICPESGNHSQFATTLAEARSLALLVTNFLIFLNLFQHNALRIL